MKTKKQKTKLEPLEVITIALVLFFIAVLVITAIRYNQEEKGHLKERNLQGELMLGLIPNTEPHERWSGDELVGYVKDRQGNTYELIKDAFGRYYINKLK